MAHASLLTQALLKVSFKNKEVRRCEENRHDFQGEEFFWDFSLAYVDVDVAYSTSIMFSQERFFMCAIYVDLAL